MFCLAFRRPILYLFGASDLTFPYANDYLTILSAGHPLCDDRPGDEPFINAQGFGKVGMCTVLLGAVANIILDPIFIFGLAWESGGLPCGRLISQFSAVWIVRS